MKTLFYGQINTAVETKIGFCMFCYEVNRPDGPDTITVECFEKGQKFTSACSFHR